MFEQGRSRKTVTRAIRVDEDLDKGLATIASKEGTSVNFIVNKALRKYVDWDYLAGKYGVTSDFAAASAKLLDYLSDEEVIDFGRWVANKLFREYVTFWFKRIDFETILKAIRLLGVAGNFQYDEYFGNDVRSIVCKHNSGRKRSRFYAEMFKDVFKELADTEVKIESTENQVLVQFSTSKEAFLGPVYEDLQKHKAIR